MRTQTRSKLKRAPGGGFDGSITETVWEGWEGRTGQELSLGGLKESGFKSPTFWVPEYARAWAIDFSCGERHDPVF
ncbi:hypothetical protein HCBG_08734 [Histoplasma capsulatum G186AR]|uniref:Uncharacterized protein n=1 Tax=Ajellomyces capsulatus (strain G186AR / H82 / ATCC MYA-2454 / RMSCC 2432) TaxID=447093 RepID=C0P004_AJECG|nr:uncharacterized protein HCBG_08734 [Histoplasma capsulatum G186AR]EEH03094.1 hypothetical protein HCBG_08734 [Histoplasma capsulatum G186AR]